MGKTLYSSFEYVFFGFLRGEFFGDGVFPLFFWLGAKLGMEKHGLKMVMVETPGIGHAKDEKNMSCDLP